jgi:hypothetical protein
LSRFVNENLCLNLAIFFPNSGEFIAEVDSQVRVLSRSRGVSRRAAAMVRFAASAAI